MFDLMRLPAELRIKIYEYALIRNVIRIVHTVQTIPPGYPFRLDELYEEPNPRKIETLRSRCIEFVNLKNAAGGEVRGEISSSYGIHPDQSPPVVNLFLTNRKVYSETWPIFYQRNAFAFTVPLRSFTSAELCLRFLYDRPYHALQHIRELHLLLGLAPQHPLSRDIVSQKWQRLLTEISRYMSVRVLVLYLRGRVDEAPEYNYSDFPWKEWLCKVTGLRELHMDLIGESTHEQNIAFAKEMRSKMVVGGEQMGTEDFVLGKRSMPCIWWTIETPGNSLRTSSRIPEMDERLRIYPGVIVEEKEPNFY